MDEPRKKIIKKSIVTKNGWIRCPYCRRILARAYYNGEASGIEIRCRCRNDVELCVKNTESFKRAD